MAPFRRRREPEEPSGPPAPEWASFFDAAEWAAFVETVREVLDDLGLRFELDAEQGVVDFEGSGAGLANLAQTCRPEPREAWPEIVADHFRQLLASGARDAADLSAEEALPLLRLRLWAEADLLPDAELVRRPFADLAAVVVLDLPETLRTVRPDEAEGWGLTVDEALDRAARATRAETDLTVQDLAFGDGATVAWGESASFFAATRALWPEDVLGRPPGPEGAIIAVPNRHLVGVHPVGEADAAETIAAMERVARRAYEDGPGSISPHLYRWRAGEVVRLEDDR